MATNYKDIIDEFDTIDDVTVDTVWNSTEYNVIVTGIKNGFKTTQFFKYSNKQVAVAVLNKVKQFKG